MSDTPPTADQATLTRPIAPTIPSTNNRLAPAYYNSGDQDLIALAFSLGKGEHFCAVNVAKYALRYDKKDGLQDLNKARVYLDRLIAHLERQQDAEHDME